MPLAVTPKSRYSPTGETLYFQNKFSANMGTKLWATHKNTGFILSKFQSASANFNACNYADNLTYQNYV